MKPNDFDLIDMSNFCLNTFRDEYNGIYKREIQL